MNARWRQVEDLFHEALGCAPEDRVAFLTAACGADRALFDEVQSLMDFEESGRLLQAVVEEAAEDLRSDIVLRPGSRVGPYVILREIGHGGMGIVYQAERADGQFAQTVALKVIGDLPAAASFDRFLAERQMLANLQHPNIARLLDGGSTDAGQPYFAMEYLEGEPLTDYFARKQSTLAERLEVFEQVCAAIHYAHQQLVVHCDLKPSNILILADGTAKVLDFGIAKLMQKTPFVLPLSEKRNERNEPRLLTPCYSSPEQFRGLPVSTVADVYSLGAVLYEVLAGHRPYDFQNVPLAQMERAICEVDPPKPSLTVASAALSRPLRGDLDAIVQKAMAKPPEARYGSALELAEDLRRHRQGYPVMARGSGMLYRAGKYVKRHRIAMSAASLLLLSWIAATSLVVYQARVAQRRAVLVRNLADTLLVDFNDNSGSPQVSSQISTAKRAALVERAVASLGELSSGQGKDASFELQRQMAVAYRKVGDAQGDPLHRSLGDSTGAEKSYRASLEILERLIAQHPKDRTLLIERIRTLDQMGLLMRDSGSQKAARTTLLRAAALCDELWKAAPNDVALGNLSARTWENLSRYYSRQGLYPDAQKATSKAYEIVSGLIQDDPHSRPLRETLADVYGGRMDYEIWGERLEDANRDAQVIMQMREEMVRESPDDFDARRNLLLAYARLGDVQGYSKLPNLGDHKGAAEQFRKAVNVAEALSAADPTDHIALYDLEMSRLRLGATLVDIGADAEAIQYFRAGAADCNRLLESDGKNRRHMYCAAWFHEEIAKHAARVKNPVESRANFERAEALAATISARDASDAAAAALSVVLSMEHASMEGTMGDAARVPAIAATAMQAGQVLETRGSPGGKARAYQGYATIGDVYLKLGDRESARRFYTLSVEGFHRLQESKTLTKLFAAEPARAEALLASVSDVPGNATMAKR